MHRGMNTVNKLMPVHRTPNRFLNPKIQCILLLKNLRMVGMVAVLCGIMIIKSGSKPNVLLCVVAAWMGRVAASGRWQQSCNVLQ